MEQVMEIAGELFPINESSGELLYTTLTEYKGLINTPPKKDWIKTNPYSNNARYLPIRIVEELLNKIYPAWQAEQVGTPQVLGNSIVISVNLKVFNPLINQWLTYPGVGAVPIEVKSGAHPTDWTKINSKAMHKNTPAALSFAMSNAAKKIGKLFGSHLNSKETIG